MYSSLVRKRCDPRRWPAADRSSLP